MAKKSFFNSSVEGIIKGFESSSAEEGAQKNAPAAEFLSSKAADTAPVMTETSSPLVSAFFKNRQEQKMKRMEQVKVNVSDENGCAGRIISVSSLKVEIFLKRSDVGIRDLLYTEKDGVRYLFEVQEINGSVAAAICRHVV